MRVSTDCHAYADAYWHGDTDWDHHADWDDYANGSSTKSDSNEYTGRDGGVRTPNRHAYANSAAGADVG